MLAEHIIDNRQAKMATELKKCCAGTHTLNIAVGYFYVSGFNILRDSLGGIGKIRLIMGDETDRLTADQLRAGHEATHTRAIRERMIRNMNDVSSGPEADALMELYEYIQTGKMEVRIYVKNKFHAKAYIFERSEPSSDVAFVGSSNLSGPGLGDEEGNTELNIQSCNEPIIEPLSLWYNKIWNDARPYNDELVRIIKGTVPFARRQKDQEYVVPRELFKIMAYELLNSNVKSDEGMLAEFQKIGMLNAWDKIQKFDGCIVADSVGLGKTFIGMELIRMTQLDGRNALIIVPKNVEQNWRRELKKYGGIILDESRLKIITADRISRLDRDQPDDLAELGSLRDSYDFIVIDEAHRFRNWGSYDVEYHGNKNYANLDSLKREKTQYVLLTATPLNNSVGDLKNLVSIFTAETKLKNTDPSLDFSHFDTYDKIAKQIKKLKKNDPAYRMQLAGLKHEQKPSIRGITRILEEIMVLRTRSDISERYPDLEIDGKRVSFKSTNVIPRRCEFTPEYMQLYENVVALLISLNVPHMSMKTGGSAQLQGLYKMLLYKRLESSIHSFVKSLENLMRTEEDLLEQTSQVGWERAVGGAHADDDIGLDEYAFGEADGETAQDQEAMDALRDDIRMIKEFIGKYIGPIRRGSGYIDPKLDMLRDMLESETGKVLVFTQYADTAEYLYHKMGHVAKTVDCVSGTGDLGTDIATDMKVKLFAPTANDYKPTSAEHEIDILIATDTLSEGVNLQDCGVVVNYDIPWNPMRMVQRAGRADRIGNTSRTTVYNILPDEEFDELFLGLLGIVAEKIETITDILGTENQIVTGDETASPKTFGEAVRKMGDPGDIGAYEKMGRNRLFGTIRTKEERSAMMLKIKTIISDLGLVQDDFRKYDAVMYSTVSARKADRKGIFMMFDVVDVVQGDRLNTVIIFRENNGSFREIFFDDFLASIPMHEYTEGILRTGYMDRALEEIEEHFKTNRFKDIRDRFRYSQMGTAGRVDTIKRRVVLRLGKIRNNESLDGSRDEVTKLHERLTGATLRSQEVNLLRECFGGKNAQSSIGSMPKDKFIGIVADFCRQHMENNPNYPPQRRAENIEYRKICWGAFV